MHMKSFTSRAEEPPSLGAAYGPVKLTSYNTYALIHVIHIISSCCSA